MVKSYRIWLGICAALWLGVASPLNAKAEGGGDGFYGRWERDSTLGFQLGILREPREHPGAFLAGRWLLIDAVGPTAGVCIDADGGVRPEVGLIFFPLFPALPMLRLATYRPWIDLWIQSLSVGLGVTWRQRQELDRPDFYVGFGTELPLWLPTERGIRVDLSLEARRWWRGEAPAEAEIHPWDWRVGVGLRFSLRTGIGSHEPE